MQKGELLYARYNGMHFNIPTIFVMEELYFFLIIRPDRLS